MENKKIEIVYKGMTGRDEKVIIEGGTIQFGGVKVSLAELGNMLMEERPSEYSRAIHNLVYSWAQVTVEATNHGAKLVGMLPNSSDHYYAKILADSFANMEVK